jgi:fumarate reductase subunit D
VVAGAIVVATLVPVSATVAAVIAPVGWMVGADVPVGFAEVLPLRDAPVGTAASTTDAFSGDGV